MPVTELALLRLTSPNSPLSNTTKATLHKAQKAQTAYSGHQLHFLRQIEDPCLFYVLGGWESVAKHNEDWIPGETNQGLMKQLKNEVGVEWMFHIDMDPLKMIIPLDAPVVGISRYFVESSKKEEFERVFGTCATAPYTYCGGWRIDKEGEDEEFVVLSGKNRVEDSFSFKESSALAASGKIKDFVKDVEIRHVRIEKWE